MEIMMSQQRVYELECELRNKTFGKSHQSYIEEYMSGHAEGLPTIDEFVGTIKTIEEERARRSDAAREQFAFDYACWNESNIVPIGREISKITMDLIPKELEPAKEIIYGMAYERGHSSGYSEVYGILDGMIPSLLAIVAACAK